MKKLPLIAVLLSFLCLSGCDFVRKVAGRPTSEELVKIRGIKAEDLRRKAVRDSIELAEMEAARIREEAMADSIQASDFLMEKGVVLSDVFSFGIPTIAMDRKFYLIVGVYRSRQMAVNKFYSVTKKGFEPLMITFENGANAVSLGSSDKLSEIAFLYNDGVEKKVCPRDAWVYVNQCE